MPKSKTAGKIAKPEGFPRELSRGSDFNDYMEEVQRIRDGWRDDFELFCREKLKIVNKMATNNNFMVPFEFNECQKALNDLIEKIGDFNEVKTAKLNERNPSVPISRLPIEIIILKARKVGVSTFLEARAYWKAALFKEQKCLIMAHERPAAQNIADIAQRFDIYWDPDEPVVTKIPLSRMSDDLIEWEKGHGSSIVVETAGSKGGGSSRSFTYHLLHMSEVGFYPSDSAQVAAALSARALYHETYFESTPNGTGNMFYEDWQNAMWFEDIVRLSKEGALPRWWNGKVRFFWPWFAQSENIVPLLEEEDAYITETLDDEEKLMIEEFDLSNEQIAWRRAQIAGPCSKQNAMSAKEYFKQEHPSTPEEGFIAKSQALFDPRPLNAMSEASKLIKPVFVGHLMHDPDDPIGFRMMKGGEYVVPLTGSPSIIGATFVQWELPEKDTSYVMGADSAEGLEHGDWSVITICSRTNGTVMKEVARYRGKTPARELAEIADFLGRMYNDAYLVAERNPPGNAMCERLLELGYPNLYHHRNIESVTDMENPSSFTVGFRTTTMTKPMICERGVQALRDNAIILRHPDAIKEWKYFSRVNRIYSAPNGMNDDCVIADLLAYFGMEEAPPMLIYRSLEAEKEEEENAGLSAEEIQSKYWQKKIKEVRERAAERNVEKIEYLMRKVKVNGDVFH